MESEYANTMQFNLYVDYYMYVSRPLNTKKDKMTTKKKLVDLCDLENNSNTSIN